MTSTSTKLLYDFDDLMSCSRVLFDSSHVEDFLKFVQFQEEVQFQLRETREECRRLKESLDEAIRDCSVLDSKLTSARKWLDIEREQRKKVENERDSLGSLLEELRRILLNDPRNKLPDETRDKISSMSKSIQTNNIYRSGFNRVNTMSELDSSDVSISRSEDDLDESMPRRRGKHRLSCVEEETFSIPKKRTSMYPPIAPLAPKPESLESTEESERDAETNSERCTAFDRLNTRAHNFEDIFVRAKAELCVGCGKKIRLKTVSKCIECKSIAHHECRNEVPLPCIALGTPLKSEVMGSITDYVPSNPPLVPAVVLRCVNEIEQRGLKEVGIYRIPGDQREVRNLKEKFLKCKGVPSLSQVDIHTVCSYLKDFLRCLRDPLIPQSKWSTFASAVSDGGDTDELCRAISSLPRANRDTLAFLILHLQRVAKCADCNMSLSNLATVFGPTVVGHSNEVDPLTDAEISNRVVGDLLKLDSEYWSGFLDLPPPCPTPRKLSDTPSSKGSLRKTPRKYFRP